MNTVNGVRRVAASLLLGIVLVTTLVLPAAAENSDEGWRAEYYRNRYLTGSRLVRRDSEINFDWGQGSPRPSLPADNFSVRWTRNAYFQAGRYRFTTVTDDGVRLFVDGRLIIDQWREMAPTQFTAEVELTQGWHGVRMEYYEAGGGAMARLSWSKVDGGAPDGWQGDYYSNRWFSGMPALTRYDAQIGFDWGVGSPDWRLPADNFSVRWTRNVPFRAGRYIFTTRTDDGVRLYVDGRLVIDQWRDMAPTEHRAEVELSGGWHNIRMDYYEASGGATAWLLWDRAVSPDGPITEWRGEYYNNIGLSGSPTFIRNDKKIDFDWSWGRPDSRLPADRFSVRWTRELRLARGTYRFTTQTDDGVRLFIDNELVINEWRAMARTQFSKQITLGAGAHTIRMEYFELDGEASASLTWEGPQPVPTGGNLVTHVTPYPSYSWIKVYRLTGDNKWQDLNPGGWASLRPDGLVKIDGLPVDYFRYGEAGHPYRVEQWVDGWLVRTVGDILRGQAPFLIRPDTDNYTPW